MRKLFVTTILIFFVFGSFAQKFEVTPNGLKDASNLDNSHVVIEADGVSASELYNNAYRFIQENYKNPKEVIKGNVKGEYLKFDTYAPSFIVYNNSGAKIPINATYTTELRFKDGKVRYEIVSLGMKGDSGGYSVLFTGGLLQGYIVFKKNGSLLNQKRSKIWKHTLTQV